MQSRHGVPSNRSAPPHPTRRRRGVLAPLFVLARLLFACSSSSPGGFSPVGSSGLTLVDTFEGGTLYRTDAIDAPFNVAVLEGDWHEMGRQYGFLLRREMEEFDQAASRDIATDAAISDAIYERQPAYVKELIAGMAETSGFSLEKQKLVTNLFVLGVIQYHCSQMSAWGDYTAGGILVHGRNWDYGGPFATYKNLLSVVVYRPAGSQNAVADINFVGALSMTTAMNSRGLFAAVNDGSLSDPSFAPDHEPINAFLSDLLFTSSDMEAADARILDHAHLPATSATIHLADANESRAYECATYDAKRRTGAGLLASTNHFVDPAWSGLPLLPSDADSGYSEDRLAHLLALGESYKGRIDAVQMMRFLDTPFSIGGATWPDATVYQVVAVPADRVIWLKAPGYSRWTRIDLGALFD